MITIWTQAYNTEKYIRQCIESVLNQTYTEFEYILVDNGSTDSTGAIIDEYAVKDKRIRAFHEIENRRECKYHYFIDNMRGEYFAALDSDDWLEPDFFTKLITFSEQEHLDMCICGSWCYHEKTGKTGVLRIPSEKLVFSYRDTPHNFSIAHQFLRTTWGKLIRTKAIQKAELTLFKDLVDKKCNGVDTAFTMSVFESCDLIGMLDCNLHNYRIREGSAFQEYQPNRYEAYEKLYDQTIQLLTKFGPLSPINQRFTAAVFFNALRDIFSICINSRLSEPEKINEIADILSKPRVMNLRKARAYEEDTQILKPYIDWALKKRTGILIPKDTLKKIHAFVQPELYSMLSDAEIGILFKHYDIVVDIYNCRFMSAYECLSLLAKINPKNRTFVTEQFCLSKITGSDLERLSFFLRIAEKYPAQQSDLLELVIQILGKNKLLATIDRDPSIFACSDVLESIFKGNNEQAIALAAGLLENQNFKYKLFLSRLMKIVAAFENTSDAFVYFSKVYAVALLEADLFVEAGAALNELKEMLPQDAEVEELMNYLPNVEEEG